MKNKFFLLYCFILAFIMQSCREAQWYCQVFSVKSTEENNDVVFSNNGIKISYDFWAEGGSASFWIENNTTEDIYLDLSKSFFINNGVVFDYYKNRVFGQTMLTTGFNTSNTVSYDKSTQVYYMEEKILCIPANSCRRIECEQSIYSWLYRDCNLFVYGERGKKTNEFDFSKSSTFNKSNSPIVFRNVITYYIAEEKPEQMRKITNEFYVDEITNFPQNQIFEYRTKDTTMCGKEYYREQNVIMVKAPHKFYHRYTGGIFTPDGH